MVPCSPSSSAAEEQGWPALAAVRPAGCRARLCLTRLAARTRALPAPALPPPPRLRRTATGVGLFLSVRQMYGRLDFLLKVAFNVRCL